MDAAQGQQIRQDRAPPDGWEKAFARTLESQVVPQLLALRAAHVDADAIPADEAMIAALADEAVAHDFDAAAARIRAFAARTSLANALLNLAAPAARRLGVDWEIDRRDFMDVTVGLGVLQRIISDTAGGFLGRPLPNRRLLLGPTPGEHHTFGLSMVDYFFRVARWDVDFRPHADRETLIGAVGTRWYAVLGLSLSGDTLVDEAATTVRMAREASRNGQLHVLVGGPAFLRQKELAVSIGADALAQDGHEAVVIANAWAASGALERAQ
ncbi:MAG: cobalamin B12-binding domain-containing protein [Pseudomonadota bacterium]